MGQALPIATTILDLVALAISLGLGLYILTRNPRNLFSWLAALCLGALAALFLHNALLSNQPDSKLLPWLRAVILFAPVLFFHLIVLWQLGRRRAEMGSSTPAANEDRTLGSRLADRWPGIASWAVVTAYAAALVLAALTLRAHAYTLAPANAVESPQDGWPQDPLYLVYAGFIVILSLLSLYTLWQGYRSESSWMRRRQLVPILAGASLVILGALYLSTGIWLQLDLPTFPQDLIIATGVVLVGFSVARHNALVEGRVIERDAFYIIIAVGSLTLFYVAISQMLYWSGHSFSFITLVLVIVIAISSLMLYDGLRSGIDRIFYRDQFRTLRANMRSLAREAGAGQSLSEQLNALLVALCRNMGIRRAFIALAEQDGFVVEVSLGSRLQGQTLPRGRLATQEIRALQQPHDGGPTEAILPGLTGMRLVVPLVDGEDQLGALVLGRKHDGSAYQDDDLILLEDMADQLASVIQAAGLQQESALRINAMVADFRRRERALQRQVQEMLNHSQEPAAPTLHGLDEDQLVALTEDALRNLHDYPCLGEHPLADLGVLRWELQGHQDPFITHIDRGKALSKVMQRALGKLRPEGDPPGRHAVPPREWHQFIILNDAYVEGELNRDIMSRLYISEGTFNRTRRRAVRGVAKALKEMEIEAQRQMGAKQS